MALEDIAKTTVITSFGLFEYLLPIQTSTNITFDKCSDVPNNTESRSTPRSPNSVREIDFLDHHISDRGIKPLPEKTQPILNYPAPQSVKSLRRFLAVVNYYGRIISNCVYVLQLLTDLLKGNPKHFKMTSEAEPAFSVVKQELSKATTLNHLGLFSVTRLYLKTDVSQVAVGAVMQQMVKGAFVTTTARKKQRNATDCCQTDAAEDINTIDAIYANAAIPTLACASMPMQSSCAYCVNPASLNKQRNKDGCGPSLSTPIPGANASSSYYTCRHVSSRESS
nr:gag pol polyprotein [Hymenolepis microstoma]